MPALLSYGVKIRNGLLSLFFPSQCAGCKRYIKDFKYLHLCPECYDNLRQLPKHVCPMCAKPINSKHADGCKECRERKNNFSYIKAAGVYEGGLKEIIHYMKFNKKKGLAKVAAQLITERTGNDIFEGVDYIVPVPLGAKSLAERSYNQTAMIAGYLSKAKAIPLLNAVKKIKETAPQNTLDRFDRMKNLKGAFVSVFDLSGKVILVVDDVFTTGATINEVAGTLKAAGAVEVRAITAARSI